MSFDPPEAATEAEPEPKRPEPEPEQADG
jgi:hypothetical protein